MTDFPLPKRVDWISRAIFCGAFLFFGLGAVMHYEPSTPLSWKFYAYAVAAGLTLAALFAPVRIRALLVPWL